MKRNRINLLLAAIASTVLFCQSAGATAILTEQFANYTSGLLGSTPAEQANGWNNSAQAMLTVTNGTGSLIGTNLGLISSFGDRVVIAATYNTNASGVPNGTYNKFAAAAGTYPPTVTTNLYTSFLYRFNVGTDVTAGGNMIACMELQSGGIQSGSPSGIDAYWQVFARNVAGNIQLGLSKNCFNTAAQSPYSPGVTNWAPGTVGVGQTFFVVVRLQLNATNGVTTVTNGVDVIDDLWVNPPPSFFGTNEANVPTPSATSPVGDGAVPTSVSGPGRFFVVDSGCSGDLDELRIANNWADVTPWFGQCQGAAFTLNLTNITQSAEIGVNLNVAADNSTAPTFQWQISGPGSSVWTNISGAVFSSYTSPNLTLASDNGDKFRTILTVACNGSSLTSAVSTVTLTAPVVTPAPSLVMHDNFSSTFRAAPPVTTNNSVWYTSVTADLDSGSSSLVGITISNTSSLWLGYFVDESTTNLPVHLAVGSQIKVTLPFTPGTYGLFTTNGAMRFGLYDYADGGTLVAADGANATGSTGNGTSVRGYMVEVSYGQVFNVDSNLTISARTGLGDIPLMSTTGSYETLGTGPAGGAYSNTPAFQSGTTYTLQFTVARTDVNVCSITATFLTNNVSWLTLTATDTNNFIAYHRFDAFGVWNVRGINSADSFTFPFFDVQVLPNPVPPITSIHVTSVARAGNNVTVTWAPTPAGSYNYTVYRKTALTNATWSTLQTGISTTTYTDITASGNAGFYRVSSP